LRIGETIGPIDYSDLPAVKIDGAVEAADGRERYVHELGLYTDSRDRMAECRAGWQAVKGW
jgi:hypothetical protein